MRFPEEMKKGKKIEQVKWRKKCGSCLEENRKKAEELGERDELRDRAEN